MNCNTKLVKLRGKVDMYSFDMIQYEFFMQKITNYAAIALLMWMSHATADDTVAGLAKIKKLQKESAIPSWQAATQQITDYHDSMQKPFVLQKWKVLDDWVNTHPQQAPITIITNPRDEFELTAYVDWLRWRILTKNTDGRYSYAYAYLLSQLDDSTSQYMEEMLVFYLHANLSLQIDELRCANKMNRGFFSREFEAQDKIKKIHETLANLSDAQINNLTQNAETIEELRGEREPNIALCTQSLRGKTFISEKLWQKQRRQLMDTILAKSADYFQ
jgi:hypothetical protein